MTFIEQIENCIPDLPDSAIPWDRIDRLLAGTCFTDTKTTHQDPVFHGEDDVYTHTRMVCEELAGDQRFHALPRRQKSEIFLAAILHDIGKVKTTKREGESWVSPHHALTGSKMVRSFLWQECGLCGTVESIVFRETVCALVRHHMRPLYLAERSDSERRIRETASEGELAKDFTLNLLYLLAEADVRGRIAGDIPEGLGRIELAGLMTADLGCLHGPYRFAGDYTKRAYFSGRNVLPDQKLFDDSWGEVIILSGLPGTGKDTWIRQNAPDRPVVSLDHIRAELKVRPEGNQGAVVQAARERAREHLRKKEPFVWNATSLMPETRQKLTGLFENYGARVRIVYLETDLKTRESRNAGRPDCVPESTVVQMIERTVPPFPKEAQTVEWICV